jgi:hypothetical protein
MKSWIMLVLGEPQVKQTELGNVLFLESFKSIGYNGEYLLPLIMEGLVTGRRTRRATLDDGGIWRGSPAHVLAQANNDIVQREHPRAEWHYMKVDALPLHVFVATEQGRPVAIAVPMTSQQSEIKRIARWKAMVAA